MPFPQDAILAIALRFELFRGLNLHPIEIEEIQKHRLEAADPEELARALQHLIQTEPVGHIRGGAYWALGKRRDPNLIPFFTFQLGLELNRDIGAVYQILIALDDLGEQPFPEGRTSMSSLDDEENRRDAEAYLRRVA